MPALPSVPSRFSFKSCNDFTILAMITLYSGLEMWMKEIMSLAMKYGVHSTKWF
jgi:hypothetical protein